LQTLLDSLFDNGWVSLGLPEKSPYDESAVHALMQN
jgi:hypothetical protein